MWYKTEKGELINLDNVTNVYLLPEGINNKHIVCLSSGKCTFITDADYTNIERLAMEENSLQGHGNGALTDNIEALGLSARILAALKRHDIYRVVDLYTLDTKKLKNVGNLGPKGLEEIITKSGEFLRKSL